MGKRGGKEVITLEIFMETYCVKGLRRKGALGHKGLYQHGADGSHRGTSSFSRTPFIVQDRLRGQHPIHLGRQEQDGRGLPPRPRPLLQHLRRKELPETAKLCLRKVSRTKSVQAEEGRTLHCGLAKLLGLFSIALYAVLLPVGKRDLHDAVRYSVLHVPAFCTDLIHF